MGAGRAGPLRSRGPRWAALCAFAAGCTAPVQLDLAAELGGADRLLVAVARSGEGPDLQAFVFRADEAVNLALREDDFALVWPLTISRDFIAADGSPAGAEWFDRARLTVSGALQDPYPGQPAPRAEAVAPGSCGRCPADSFEGPQLLLPGQSCPIPRWIPAKRLTSTGTVTSVDATRAAPFRDAIRIAMPDPCPCAPALDGWPDSTTDRDPPVLEPLTITRDPWPARVVGQRDDGTIALFSEKRWLLVDPAGRRTEKVPTSTSGVIGPIYGAVPHGDGWLMVSQRPASRALSDAKEMTVTRLDARLEVVSQAADETIVRPNALRRFAGDPGVYLIGSRRQPNNNRVPGIAVCVPAPPSGEDPCTGISPIRMPWGLQQGLSPAAHDGFRTVVHMPDGLFVAVTDSNEVAFFARTASVTKGSALAHPQLSREEQGWRWRGIFAAEGVRPRYSVTCNPESNTTCAPGTALESQFGPSIGSFGSWLVLCGRARIGGAAGTSRTIWARTASIAGASDPSAGWSVIFSDAAGGGCIDMVEVPAGGGKPPRLRVFGSGEQWVDLVERGGTLVAQPIADPFAHGFADDLDRVAHFVDLPGPSWVAVARDARISRAAKSATPRFELIAGERAEDLRYAGPLLADGDRFTAFGLPPRFTELTVPVEGPTSVSAEVQIPAVAGCGPITAAARDHATGEVLLAGARFQCNVPCMLKDVPCPGPWMFRVARDGTGTQVPLTGEDAPRGQVNVIVESAPGDFVIAAYGTHEAVEAGGEIVPDVFRLRGGELTAVRWPFGMDDPRTPAREKLPEVDRTRDPDPVERCRPPRLSVPEPRRRAADDVWRSGVAGAGVVWLGGCQRILARVIGGTAERVISVVEDPFTSGSLSTGAAVCADHVLFGITNAEPGFDTGAMAELKPGAAPGTFTFDRWSRWSVQPARYDIGSPLGISLDPAARDVMLFWGFDRTINAVGQPGGSVTRLGHYAREFTPLSFFEAARSSSGVTVITADAGRVFYVRP